MPKFIIERTLPGAGALDQDALNAIARKSCAVAHGLDEPYQWIQSFVAGDKFYCVHVAPDEETIRKHSSVAGFPVDRVVRVDTTIDPSLGI